MSGHAVTAALSDAPLLLGAGLSLGTLWVLLLLSWALAARSPAERPLSSAAITLLGVAYAGALPASIIVIRHAVEPARSWSGLWLVCFPLAVTWGVLAFVTNYIPNIGFIIGVVPPALLGLLTGGPQLMLLVIVVYCVLNLVVQSIIQPRFIGDAVGLSVTVTFVALVFWAWLLGPLGAILAIPLTLLAKYLLVDIDPRAKWADALLRDTPKSPDPASDDEVAPPKKSRRWRRGEAAHDAAVT